METLQTPVPRILIVDDDPLIRRTLMRQFVGLARFWEATSGEEAIALLSGGLDVNLLLVDYWMEGINGIEVLRQGLVLAPRARRVLMTGDTSGEILEEAVNQGHIHHFIRKPWNPSELQALISQAVEMTELERQNDLLLLELKHSNHSLVKALDALKKHKRLLEQSLDERTRELVVANRELEKANLLLAAQATRDGLTGLYNHATIVSRLDEELARANRYKSSLSVLFCDIDHFKQYNDRLGHAVGDQVLMTVAKFLLEGSATVSCSRKSDIVGRYGGEEFIIILPETDKNGAMIRASRLCSGVNELEVPGSREQPLGCLSMSIGVACFPTDADGASGLLQCADTALYEAKAAGRNRVVPAIRISRDG